MLSHHAYLLRVSSVEKSAVDNFVQSLAVQDIEYFSPEAFGIGDVRTLTEMSFSRPELGDVRLIVVLLKSITIEAQQALLKLLEEPPTSTAFVFCVHDSLYLLPTLLSRFHQQDNHLVIQKESSNSFEKFCLKSITERMEEISTKLAEKDKSWVEEIKHSLLIWLTSGSAKVDTQKLSWLYYIAEHLQTRGASNKMLLEELAITMGQAAEKS